LFPTKQLLRETGVKRPDLPVCILMYCQYVTYPMYLLFDIFFWLKDGCKNEQINKCATIRHNIIKDINEDVGRCILGHQIASLGTG